jgi:hypothetical protein
MIIKIVIIKIKPEPATKKYPAIGEEPKLLEVDNIIDLVPLNEDTL